MQTIDPVSVMIGIASAIVAPHIAEVVGPYVVIILASTVGAAWALGRQGRTTRIKAIWFFFRLNSTAAIVTVFFANLFSDKIGFTDSNLLLAPVAFVIGAVGDDWSSLMNSIIIRAKLLIHNHKEH